LFFAEWWGGCHDSGNVFFELCRFQIAASFNEFSVIM